VLLKVIALIVLIAIVLTIIYLLGRWVYADFLNQRRKDAAEFQYQSDRLERLLKKAEKNEL